ncbi:MAG: flagellar hook-length control protein FliK [Proteobacteria bacterium]|nr:flagellar hook-length control protein FliK [Pseudomonadota bacterium]
MVLIPPDIGLRLRQQTELLPQPIAPLREIPAELPVLKAGQLFSAVIQEILPENTYRALVAGKSVTLSLPEAVKSGDVLDLIVVDRTPRSIIAKIAGAAAGAAEAADKATYPHAVFSRTAQMISPLLTPEGEAPPAAELNRGQPLLAQPPKSGAELVPALRKAVVESGLFYEAHQAQWVAGKLPLGNLLQEPQGQLSEPQAQFVALAEKLLLASLPPQEQPAPQGEVRAAKQAPASLMPQLPELPTAPAQGALLAVTKPSLNSLLQDTQGQHVPLTQLAAFLGSAAATPERIKDMTLQQLVDAAALAPSQPAATRQVAAEHLQAPAGPQNSLPQTAATIPDELRPLVQQQLDAAGTQRLIWHGEVWPGQTMEWRVEWDGERNPDSSQSEPEPWSTTLRLTTPRLGELEAAIRLGAGGVHIALAAPSDSSVSDLRNGAPKLEQALAAAGVPLRGLTIKQAQEE